MLCKEYRTTATHVARSPWDLVKAKDLLETLCEKNASRCLGDSFFQSLPRPDFLFDYKLAELGTAQSIPEILLHGAQIVLPREVKVQALAPKKKPAAAMRRPGAAEVPGEDGAAEAAMEAKLEAGDDGEEMEEAESDGGAEAGAAEAEDGPEDGGDEPTPKKVCVRPAAAAADPGAPAAGLLPGESYGCSKCRHAQRGCARCQLLAQAGMQGYCMRGDGVIRQAA